MKVSLNWLREYVDIDDLDLDELVNTLTMLGFEVESVTDRFSCFKEILVGKIEKISLGSRSDFLYICSINCGDELFTILSNAKNLTEGLLVPVAFDGTVMPGGWVVESKKNQDGNCAILCSEWDLFLGLNDIDVFIFGEELKVGMPIDGLFNLSDFVLDINLTPNRPDCSGIIGLAREISGINNRELVYPSIEVPEEIRVNNLEKLIGVDVVSSHDCPHYSARIFDNVDVKESPFWLKNRLISVGIKPVNNVVDVINFVMIETGHPLHAFDLDLIEGESIIVNFAQGGEVFKTIEGKDVVLSKDILTISDFKKILAVAGVIGGFNSKVSNKTKRILVESAYFNPICVRKASKKLGIRTESSYRFERGVNPNGIINALDRSTVLFNELIEDIRFKSNINMFSSPSESRNQDIYDEKIIDLNIDKVNYVLGTKLTLKEVISFLGSIEINTEIIDVKKIKVKVPSFRVDIRRLEDLIEEVARIYGYDNIPITFPSIKIRSTELKDHRYNIDLVKSVLNGFGFSEVINYSFFDPLSYNRLKIPINDYRNEIVFIKNPISSNQSAMRSTLLPGLIDTIKSNISKQIKDLMMFEVGKIFISRGVNTLPDEINMLSALWTGSRIESSWCAKDQFCDFFDIKGAVEELFFVFGIKNFRFVKIPQSMCYYTRYGYSAQIFVDNVDLGLVGELSSVFLKNYSIKQKVFIFEINLDSLFKFIPTTNFVEPISRFPFIERDATVILNEEVEGVQLIDKIKALKNKLVDKVYFLDIFRGKPIEKGKKSISFRIIYRSCDKTLDDDEVNYIHAEIVKYLVDEFNALLPLE